MGSQIEKCKYVRTPRGEFKLSEMTESEAKAKGYRVQHWSGNYVVMTKNNIAIAVKKEATF